MTNFTDQASRLTQLWSDFASKMASAGTGFQPGSMPPEMARQMRDAMFAALGSSTDQFMRSPEFLQMMKQSLDAAMTLRLQMNEFLTRLHHGGQGVARQDVDEILQAVRHLEGRVLDRLEDVNERLDKLENVAKAAARVEPRPAAEVAPKPSSDKPVGKKR